MLRRGRTNQDVLRATSAISSEHTRTGPDVLEELKLYMQLAETRRLVSWLGTRELLNIRLQGELATIEASPW